MTNRISTHSFLAFCQSLHGKRITTRAARSRFKVKVLDSGLDYTVLSTGEHRLHSRKFVDRVLDRFKKTASLKTTDYSRFTVNASYMVTLIDLYLKKNPDGAEVPERRTKAMMDSDKRDRKALKLAARKTLSVLASRTSGAPFCPSPSLLLLGSYTDGWYIRLGRASEPSLDLELWLDRYPRSPDTPRMFWFGFHTTQARNMRYLTARLPSHIRPARRLSDSDHQKVSPGTWLMKKWLTEFNRPIFETYHSTRRLFYGVYPAGRRNTALPTAEVATRAADFFSEVLWLLKKKPKAERKHAVYPQLERQVVRRHLVRERSRELPLACKQRDGFRCRVCRMTFAEVYGEELGAEFAESHHLHPLSRKRANKKTRLEDLITVCANCHRMLHLMRGREHDIEELRRCVKRGNGKRR